MIDISLDVDGFPSNPSVTRMGNIREISVVKFSMTSLQPTYKVKLVYNLRYPTKNGNRHVVYSKRLRSITKALTLRTKLITALINHGKKLFHMLPADGRDVFKISPHALSYNPKMMYRGTGDCTDLLLSMRAQGQFNPVLINTKGRIIAGLRRYFCALALGKDLFVQVTNEDMVLANIRQNRREKCGLNE